MTTSIISLLHRANQAVNTIFTEHEKGDNTARQSVVLETIANNPKCKQQTLTAITGIDRSTMSDIVRRLYLKGWVNRARQKGDQRAFALEITEKGKQELFRLKNIAALTEETLIGRIPEKLRKPFLAGLQSLST
jgi:DNA-binding MarR family transcriptional regulator